VSAVNRRSDRRTALERQPGAQIPPDDGFAGELCRESPRTRPAATIAPPQAGQVSISMPKTRLRRCARFIDVKRFSDVRFPQGINTLFCAAQLHAFGRVHQ